MAKPLKILMTAGIALLAILIIGIVALYIFFPKERAKDLALEKITAAINRKVVIEDVSVSLWGGLGAYLEGIKIANPEGFTKSLFLEASALDIKVKFWPLLKGEVAIDRIILVRPRVELLKLASGQTNYTFGATASPANIPSVEKLPDEGKVAAAAFSFEKLTLEDAFISYINDSSQMTVIIHGLELNSRLKNPSTGIFNLSGDLKTDSVIYRSAAEKLPVLVLEASYQATADLNKKQAALNDTEIKINGLTFNVKAGIPNIDSFDFLNAEISADKTDIGGLLSLVPEKNKAALAPYDINGKLTLKALVKYNARSAESLAWEVEYQFDDFALAKKGLKGAFEAGQLKGKADPGNARLEIVEGRLPGGNISGTVAVVNLANPNLNAALKGDIDLAALGPFLPEKSKISLTGKMRFDIRAQGKIKDYGGMSLSGNLAIIDGSYAAEGLPEPVESFQMEAAFSSNAMTLNKFDVKFPSSDLSLTGQLTDPLPGLIPGYSGEAPRPFLTFQMKSRRFDYDKLFPEAVVGADVDHTHITVDSLPPLPIPDINGEGKGVIDTLIYSRVEITNMMGDITIQDRVIYVKNVNADVYTGKLNGEVALDISDFENPRFFGNYIASKIEVNDFMTRFTGLAGHLYGKIDMQGNFDGRGWEPEPIMQSLNMKGDASLKEGKIVNLDLLKKMTEELKIKLPSEEAVRDLASKFSVENGRVKIDDFAVKTQTGDWVLGGSAGFDGTLSYTGTVLLSESMSQNLLSQSGLVSGLAGLMKQSGTNRVKVPFKIGGSYKSPNIMLDLSRGDMIKSKVGEGLQNLLQGN